MLDETNLVQHAVKDSSPGFGQAVGERYLVFKNGKLIGNNKVAEKNRLPKKLPKDTSRRTLLRTITLHSGATYEVYERKACPIGYAVTSYKTKDEFLSIPLAQRGRALLQAIPVGKESEPLVSHVLTHASKDSLNMKEDVDNLVATAAAHHVTKFSRNTAGFTCGADGGTYFFSVPADPGWTLCIDNEESPIINACGLMLASVPEGHHTLSFTYQTPGLRTGIMVSILGWAAFTMLALRNRIIRHDNANTKRPCHNNPTHA